MLSQVIFFFGKKMIPFDHFFQIGWNRWFPNFRRRLENLFLQGWSYNRWFARCFAESTVVMNLSTWDLQKVEQIGYWFLIKSWEFRCFGIVAFHQLPEIWPPLFPEIKTHESTSIQYMILRCGMVWLKMIGPLKTQTTKTILFMEELLHQLISRIYHYLRGFIHPRWWILVLQIGTRILLTRRFESWRHPALLETSKLPTEGASREWWK